MKTKDGKPVTKTGNRYYFWSRRAGRKLPIKKSEVIFEEETPDTAPVSKIDYIGETRINYRSEHPQIKGASAVYEELGEFKEMNQEHFMALYLDGASKVIESRVIFIGTLNQSLVHPREVFRPALKMNTAGIIIAHNHPSGTLTPSRADIQITKRLKEGAKLLGVDLLDHVIIAKEGYFSFSEDGIL